MSPLMKHGLLSFLLSYLLNLKLTLHSICMNRGIGRGIALSLARDGAKVIINYNSDSKSAQAVVNTINSIKAGTAAAVQADVSKSSDVDRLFSETKRLFGKVDIVVANSGITGGGPLSLLTDAQFDRVFDINVKGVFYTLRAAANNVENNGRIIVIGSILKKGTVPGVGAYAATKAAVEVLANTLAQELGSKGITVNGIHPGI
jgi:3-oxoacyl-[acyl-carrier protein] reductase